jgi:crotonobetainyl-CoA:carnitine CoA-transferase CaiB-like acyl-CoA transferase
MATLAALYERRATGQGRLVETSLFDALADWMGYPVPYTLYGGEAPTRAGMRHATVTPYGIYRCADGAVNFAVQTETQWRNFCATVCGRPEWIDDERYASPSKRRANREALETAIDDVFSTLSRNELSRRLEAADIPFAEYREVAEFVAHPQLAARDRWADFPTPAGPIRMIVPAMDLEGMPHRLGAVPDVGEQTDEVLAELGYDPQQIAGLRAAQAV